MLQPVHPIVRRAGIYRSNRPYKLKSIRHVLTELRYLAEWAARAGLTADLSAWTHADGEAYLAERKARSFSAGRSANDLLRHLGDFRGSCPTADFPSRSTRGLQDPAAKSRLPSSRRKPSGHWYAPAGPTSKRSPPISPLLATKLRPQYAWTQNREVRPRHGISTMRLTPGCHHLKPLFPCTSTPWGAHGRRHQLGRPGSLHGTSIERHQLLRQPRTCSATSRPSGDQPRRAH